MKSSLILVLAKVWDTYVILAEKKDGKSSKNLKKFTYKVIIQKFQMTGLHLETEIQ